MISTNVLASAIAEMNKDKQGYCIRFTEGEYKGRYLSFEHGQTLARKTSNLYVTICSTVEDWNKHIEYTHKGTAFEIIKHDDKVEQHAS